MHATINTTGHTAATGAAVSTPADGEGIFIYRSGDGIGTVNFARVATVKAAGNSVTAKQYTLDDMAPAKGLTITVLNKLTGMATLVIHRPCWYGLMQ